MPCRPVEIDSVESRLTMQLGPDSTLVAARVDLAPGLDSEEVELVAERIKRSVSHTIPEPGQIFLGVTYAPSAGRAARHGRPERHPGTHADGPAATGERGGA